MKRYLAAMLLLAGPAASVLPGAADDAQVMQGATLIEQGRYDLSLPLLRAALERLPGNADILVYIAFAERRLGRQDAAMESYRLALANDPGHPGALAYQGSLFLELGQRDRAAANLARLTSVCATCPERETLAREMARGQ